MAKKVSKKSEEIPAVDPVPAAAPKKSVKPRATSVPRAAKSTGQAAVVAAVAETMITDEMIAERAYHLWRNGQPGDHYEHWMAAERELRSGR